MSDQGPNDPNNEIKELKEKLRRYEKEKRELEKQLQQLKSDFDCSDNSKNEKIKALEEELSELKRKIKQQEDELAGKDARINSIESTLKTLLNRVEKVENELDFFAKKSQGLEEERDKNLPNSDSLKKSRNMLFIGELCAKLMEAVYRQVLPVYFERGDDYKQPHLGAIDAKIEELCQTRKDKKEARKKWRNLQDEIDEGLVEFMEEKLDQRHKEAHPSPLNENELKEIARDLPGQEQQKLEKVIQLSKEMTPGIFIAF